MSKKITFQEILKKRLSRRNALKSGLVFAALPSIAACTGLKVSRSDSAVSNATTSQLDFIEVDQEITSTLHVATGYEAQVLIRWGDPLFDDALEFAPYSQSAEKQIKQFGFNNDFVGYLPITYGKKNNQHGLLVVNHESPNPAIMFPGNVNTANITQDDVDTEIVAIGMSVVEIKKHKTQWKIIKKSPHNRRITPFTEGLITGPAAGSERLKTKRSLDGIRTLGTHSNCSGGVTPWGTVLSGEENIDQMFRGDFSQAKEFDTLKRFGMRDKYSTAWGKYYDRWNLSKEPGEALHMGWIVEIDPYSPDSPIKKRSALGRFKHEGCNVFINKDKRVVAYSGDDQKFEYLYKFVSKNTYQEGNRNENMNLLDEGTLYCAEFSDKGSLKWLPLVHDNGPLNVANGFNSQADVCIDTRKAADLMGATPMDRPEDVEVNPTNGHVYVMLTNNNERKEGNTDAANPRAKNQAGQILELIPPDGDHTALSFQWEMFLIAGAKDDPKTNYHPATSDKGWLVCPDNCAFDNKGNLWIATDGGKKFDIADGIWATAVDGEHRALTKRFLSTPVGAEVCGPFFTPNNRDLFCAVQHPGESSSFIRPSTRWPDFDEKTPPRPAVVVVTKQDGGIIGS